MISLFRGCGVGSSSARSTRLRTSSCACCSLTPRFTVSSASLLVASLRRQSSSSSDKGGFPFDADDDELERELKQQAAELGATTGQVGSAASSLSRRLGGDQAAGSLESGATGAVIDIDIKRVDRPPAKFEINTTTGVYKWLTTAKYARRVVGPMREWADEFQCRTGVNVQMEAVDSDRASASGYPSADDVEVALYLFGSERAIHESVHFLKAMVQTEPSYVRCGIFRRTPEAEGKSQAKKTASGNSERHQQQQEDDVSLSSAVGASNIEWLTLRRVNPELRPIDIPPISLKTPGKFTLLFESAEEAIVRTVYEETGLELDRKNLRKTHVFDKAPVPFWWRPRVDYWVCEVPHDAEVLGPQTNTQKYVMHWDPRLLRQSADPVDRTWAAVADPKTGCAWLSSKVVDALQAPVKLETNYMATRYTPAPATTYSDVVKF